MQPDNASGFRERAPSGGDGSALPRACFFGISELLVLIAYDAG